MNAKKPLFILSVIFCVFLCSSAFADQSGDFTYTVSNNQVAITGYTGAGGAVEIPETIEGMPVVNIDNQAFLFQASITCITIPGSVTSIGSFAFAGCTGVTNVIIPSSVTSIGDNAFFWCTGLTCVTIGKGVTSIGDYAFYSCYKLVRAYFYCNAPTLGANVFLYAAIGFTVYYTPEATGFTNPWYGYPTLAGDFIYTVSNNQVTITGYTGAGGAVVIPDTIDGMPVVSIGVRAFQIQTSITGITIPNSVTIIEDYAFLRCSGIVSITIANSVTSIGAGAFQNCSGIINLTIPGSVTSIGDYAFQGCTGLASLTIMDGIVSIGEYAFSSCKSLTSVAIPNSVASIENYAFGACNFNSISIGNGLARIGDKAFCYCFGLTDISVDTNNGVFSSRDGVLYDKMHTFLVHYPHGKPGVVTIPDGVTSIGNYAFQDYTSLTSVTIPNSVTSIGCGAFLGCTGLTSVTIPTSVTSMSGELILQTEKGYASISPGSFSSCSNLTAAYFLGNAPQILYQDSWYPFFLLHGNGSFSPCASGFTIYYTAEATGFTNPWYGYPTTVLTDDDSDGTPGTIDNCPAIANPRQLDADGDGIGDACDTTPGCGGGCGLTVCENQVDTDGDYVSEGLDNCPANCNAYQLDADADGTGDVCDPDPGCGGEGQPVCEISCDSDADGVFDVIDNCPANANPQQSDADADGIGDVCDTAPGCGGCGQPRCENQVDSDGDNFADHADNCPGVCNRYQMDADSDGAGDVCDATPACGGAGQSVCEAVCTP